jgi:serine/threonine-protein kinase
MTPERWARIKDIFTDAVQLDPAVLNRYLDDSCGPDAELRAEIVRLLSNHARAGDFLTQPVGNWIEAFDSGISLAPGEVLGGRFQIVRLLGRGGMGEVHEARDLALGDRVALKTLRPEIARNPRLLGRLKREVRLARKVQHPNVCRIHDFFSLPAKAGGDEIAVVAMELIVGETLAQRLARAGRLPIESLDAIVPQIAGALGAIHENGVIHRDLKPSNVMLERRADGSMRAVLTDFGIACASDDDSSLSRTGDLIGTPDYMAPEQVEFGATTAQSDIYSLGVVLYEAVTGRTPFPAGRALEGAIARLRGPATPPGAHAPGLPDRWEASILRCLELDPARRFRTAAELAAAIGGADVPKPPARRARRLSRRQFSMLAAAGACAVAGIEWKRWLPLLSLPGSKPSIVVLPFDTPAPDPELTAFGDSLADELISSLTVLRGLSVIHRDSAFHWKGRASGLKEIASRLGADTILTGALTRSPAKGVRVAARLIRASDQVYLWSRTYDSDTQSLALVEGDIANAVAGALGRNFALAQIGGSLPERRVDPEAYALYLQGRYFWNARSAESLAKALGYFEQAAARDPQFAPAYSGIADSYIALVDFGALPSGEGMPKAKAAAMRAIALDSSLAEAHATLGQILGIYEWQWLEAEASFKRALALNPNCRSARLWYGTLLAREGRFAAAIAEAREALVTDPVSLGLNLYLGWFHYFSRNFATAREQARRTLDLDSRFFHAHHLLAESCARLGLAGEALWAAREAVSLSGGGTLSQVTYAIALALLDRRDEALQITREVEASRTQRNVPFGYLALAYATLNRQEDAFRCLEESCSRRETAVVVLKAYPAFDNLKSDQSYYALLKRIGLPS